MTYGCWCDDDGRVLDDGTLTRVDEDLYRMTSADPSLAWLERNAHGFEVVIEDQSHELAALALQGPNPAPCSRPPVARARPACASSTTGARGSAARRSS